MTGREIKGESYDLRSGYFDYFVDGEYRWVQGELYLNRALGRYEHEDVSGALVYWEA